MTPAPAARAANRLARGLAALLLAAAVAAWAQAPDLPLATVHPTLHLVGDSTMADKASQPPNPEYGWGQLLRERLREPQRLVNHAANGRSTKSFRDEGRWDHVLAQLAPGDWVLIQFGHNDARRDAPQRYADADGAYRDNLRRYVREARERGANVVLATLLARRTFDGAGRLVDTHGDYPRVVREVTAELGVPLLELERASTELVQSLGPEASKRAFQWLAPGEWERFPDGRRDDTHFSRSGARLMAGLAADLIRAQGLPLAGWLVPAQAIDAASVDSEGWALGTRGGRGGRIERVTTLAAAGPGSLRAALDAEGPRIVVFEVGGVIDMGGANTVIRNPYLTVAGQTAPSPGITLIKGEIEIAAHDVIVQHLMIRPGEFGRPRRGGGDQDGISTVGGAYRVIVDHCSLSWATDENLSVSGPRFDGNDPDEWRHYTSHDVTYSHNLIYEGLSNSVHAKGEHSKGSLIHDNATGVLLLANVYASNRQRNALFKGGAWGAMVNNLIFNPGNRAVHYNLFASEWQGRTLLPGRLTLLSNVYRQGPDTARETAFFMLGGEGEVELFLQDNLALDAGGAAVAQIGSYSAGGARIVPAASPYLPPGLRVYPAQLLEQDLPRAVGARPWDRDPIDARLLAGMARGQGRIVDSERDTPDGYPAYAATRRAFDPAAWNLDDMSPRAGWASLAREARIAR